MNVSVRTTAGSGGETLIVGFAVGGQGNRSALLRGIGPSLTPFGVTGAMPNPQLRLYNNGTLIAQNDDWGGSAGLASTFRGVGAFVIASDSRDAVLLESLEPGSYSAHLVSDGPPWIALIECYDAGGSPTAYLTNVSARSLAGNGASVLTIGFVISGTELKTVLLRGVGPGLAPFGVTNVLANPRLRLFDHTGSEIANNDNWSTEASPPSVFTSVGAFGLTPASRDAVLFFALQPGTYTAQVSGVGSTTGSALIEAYEVNNSPVPVLAILPVVNPASTPPFDAGVGTPSPGLDMLPQAIVQTRPVYPLDLRRASVTGEAYIDFYVKTDGTVANAVANAVALRATDIRFATSAADAVRTWVFRPGRRNGTLVITHMQVPIYYSIDEG